MKYPIKNFVWRIISWMILKCTTILKNYFFHSNSAYERKSKIIFFFANPENQFRSSFRTRDRKWAQSAKNGEILTFQTSNPTNLRVTKWSRQVPAPVKAKKFFRFDFSLASAWWGSPSSSLRRSCFLWSEMAERVRFYNLLINFFAQDVINESINDSDEQKSVIQAEL